MRGRGARAALLAAVAVSLAPLAGCGGDDTADVRAQQLAQARSYAAGVSAVTQRTSTGLAAISDGADYRDATAAAASTREYAGVIRAAAAELQRAEPPAKARADHEALVALYRATATEMDRLATTFAQVRGERALTATAQDLSAAVQRYSTQELQLRTAIERALPAVVTPSPRAAETATPTATSPAGVAPGGVPAAPGAGGAGDPGDPG